jgi:hypothetical protein
MPRDRDPARSYDRLGDSDLARLGRVADADLDAFFGRNPRLAGWRERIAAVALAQGAAEHRLRGERGIWDLDVIVCFSESATLPRLFRRQVVCWDWGASRFGRCPYDPPEYAGRAVDVKYWTVPPSADPVDGVVEWLARRAAHRPDPARTPDLAHEPVILIRPRFGEVIWDPGAAPPPRAKTAGHRRPHGAAPA